MDGSPLGLVEICLGFGAVLALAAYEVVRNRRALARLREKAPDPPASRPPG